MPTVLSVISVRSVLVEIAPPVAVLGGGVPLGHQFRPMPIIRPRVCPDTEMALAPPLLATGIPSPGWSRDPSGRSPR